MKIHVHCLLLFISISSAYASSKVLKGPPGLQERIESILKSEGIKTSDIGIFATDSVGGELFGINEKRSFISASVMKIVTAQAALEELGPAFQFQTQIFADSGDLGPVLRGPVYLKGGGDPSFVSEKMWYLVNEFSRDEIIGSEGGLVVDDTRFDAVRFEPGRLPSQEDRAFDAPVGALSFNWNSVNVFVRPGKIGSAAKVVLDPLNNYVELINRTTTTANGPKKPAVHLNPKQSGIGEIVNVSGPVGSQTEETAIYRMISEPDLWTGTNFVSFAQKSGIVIRGSVRKGRVPEGARLVRQVPGSPLRKILDDMLKFSNNFVAEMLTKDLAAESGEKPATMKTGLEIIKRYLAKWGVPAAEYQITSPSGLSRQNLLSPNALVMVLNRTKLKFGTAPEILAGLPVGGIDGTLKNRMQSAELKGHVRAKTGMLDGVVSLAGFVERTDGKFITFAMLYNGGKDYSLVHHAYERICTELTKTW